MTHLEMFSLFPIKLTLGNLLACLKSDLKQASRFPKVNFIGNKENISRWVIDNFPAEVESIFDAFSGGSSIGYFAKQKGLRVVSNDVLKVNYLIAKSII